VRGGKSASKKAKVSEDATAATNAWEDNEEEQNDNSQLATFAKPLQASSALVFANALRHMRSGRMDLKPTSVRQHHTPAMFLAKSGQRCLRAHQRRRLCSFVAVSRAAADILPDAAV
jgi:hypothetical protein